MIDENASLKVWGRVRERERVRREREGEAGLKRELSPHRAH